MKEKLITLAVTAALGAGVIGYAHADPEGVKAYIRSDVVNLRLVNPVSGNVVNFVGEGLGDGATTARISVNGFGDIQSATEGFWLTSIGKFDAEQACINGAGEDFQTNPPAVPCPGDPVVGNDFTQVGEPLFDDPTGINYDFQDFSRSDQLILPGTGLPNTPDFPGFDGDDTFVVAGCQRSGLALAKQAFSNTSLQALAQQFTTDQTTQTLEFRGDYSAEAHTVTSANVEDGSAAQANNSLNFQITRTADRARVQCNTLPGEVSAQSLDPDLNDNPSVAPNVFVCDAASFVDAAGAPLPGQVFEPGVVYEGIANFSADASCLLLPTGVGVYKWWFGKQIAPFDADNPELVEPINVTVNLKDQFVDDQLGRDYSVRSLRGLQTPAGKDEPVDPNREGHLSCWGIADIPGQGTAPSQGVDFTTANFGDDTIAGLRAARELCVTASKEFPKDSGNVEFDPSLSSYKCYDVGFGTVINEDHFLDDQFDFDEADPRTIRRLSRFCAPVTVDEAAPPVVVEDPNDPNTWQHLACYELPVKSLFPNFLKAEVADQFILDQLGQDIDFTVERELRMCEPAIKTAVDGVPLIP